LRTRSPATDATVVGKLEDTGAVILGKQALCEGAFGPYHPALPGPGQSLACVALERRVLQRLGGRDGRRPLLFGSIAPTPEARSAILAANGCVGLKPTYAA
jgi:hypothetical protein